MICGHCLQPVNGVTDHEMCKEAVWLAISKQMTEARESLKQQYDPLEKSSPSEPSTDRLF